jgi:NADPH-dependent 2,4-dienoyl-CoA reductase/sulfur reductase-like enzyme/rhodanese-related sulfurtransferase
MTMRIVVIGANAAGAKAACKAKRVNPNAHVILIDKGEYISYGACGIPYFIADVVKDVKDLMKTPVGVVRDVPFFKKVKGVDVITGAEVVEIDKKNMILKLLEKKSGEKTALPYDRLVIATGGTPIFPPVENRDLANIFTVKTIEDAILLKEKAVAGKSACIVGGGLIGLEMAEALHSRGMKITMIEMREQLLPGLLDPDMALLVEKYVRMNGVDLRTSCKLTGFVGDGSVEKVLTDQGEIAADVAVIAVGVRPNVKLAKAAGLSIGFTGAINVDERMNTSDPYIYACGDCCESTSLLNSRTVYVPLGSTANKQGRVAGINAAGSRAQFKGVLGTGLVKVFGLNVGKTGYTEAEARSAGFKVETALSPFPDRAHYMPEARPIVLKLVVDGAKGTILGLQGVGEGNVDKRLDVAAMAVTFMVSAADLSQLDLGYAPPYSAAMDNLIVAADIIKNKMSGQGRGISPMEVKEKLDRGDDFVLLDVRSPAENAEVSIEGATLIPLGMLREKLDTLPKEKEIIAFCKISLRGYEAQKILDAAGFEKTGFMDGGVLAWPYDLKKGQG